MAAAVNGTGATIVFGTSGFAANILSFNAYDAELPVLKTSHMGTTTADTFIAGDLIDWGTMTMEIQFDGDDEPALDGVLETVTIVYNKKASVSASGAILAGSGFTYQASNQVTLEEISTATIAVKWSGDLTWTDEV